MSQVLAFPGGAAEPYLTTQELSAHLGMSERWVRYQLADGLPSHVFGNRRRFRLSEVQRWIDHQRAA